MKNYNGTIKAYYEDCPISFWLNDGVKCYNNFNDENKNLHYALWHLLHNYLRRRGFTVIRDPIWVE